MRLGIWETLFPQSVIEGRPIERIAVARKYGFKVLIELFVLECEFLARFVSD
jgi:hypothetical protein